MTSLEFDTSQEVRFNVVAAPEASDRLRAAFLAGFEQVFARRPEVFNRIFEEDLAQTNVQLAVAVRGGAVETGFLLSAIDGEDVAVISALFNAGGPRGQARRLLGHALAADVARGPRSALVAFARVLPGGLVNPDAARFFASLGFAPVRVHRVVLRGDRRDRHRFATQGGTSGTVRKLELRAMKKAVVALI